MPDDRHGLRDTLRAAGDTPAGLVRVAAAVACGEAEQRMFLSSSSPGCRDYLALLLDSGWTPDDWTADRIQENAADTPDDVDLDVEAGDVEAESGGDDSSAPPDDGADGGL